jgi:hypothetical protein
MGKKFIDAKKAEFLAIVSAFRQTAYMIGSFNPDHNWKARSALIKKLVKKRKNALNIEK